MVQSASRQLGELLLERKVISRDVLEVVLDREAREGTPMSALLVQDHVIHFYHLHALDWVDFVSALSADPQATSTLAAALTGTPMVIGYRVHPLTYVLGSYLTRMAHVGLVNLVAQRLVARELIQGEFTAENVAIELAALLQAGPYRERARTGLAEVCQRLGGPGASKRAAGYPP